MSTIRTAAVGVWVMALASLGCGGEPSAPPPESDVVETESAIVNGVNLSEASVKSIGLAALYHYREDLGRWPKRPCSALILGSTGVHSYVLTAGHCVTRNGGTGSAVLPGNLIRVAPAYSPGLADPNPPASAVAAAIAVNVPDKSVDIAFVVVNADWRDRVSNRYGLYVGDPALLAGVSLYAYGYGLNYEDWGCAGNDQVTWGAGTARWGGPYTVSRGYWAGNGGIYVFPNSDAQGRKIICGDSGGPDISWFGTATAGWYQVLGVHAGTGDENFNPVFPLYLQTRIGGLYLSPYGAKTLNLGADGSTVRPFASTDSRVARFVYDRVLQQIRFGGYCLSWGSIPGGTGLLKETCSSTQQYQKWRITADLRIQNLGADSMCLTLNSSSNANLAPCSSNDSTIPMQRWSWHVQR